MIRVAIIFFCLFFLAATTEVKGRVVPDIPEVNGVYDDPGHPGIKIQVFVHKAKGNSPAKPEPLPSPSLVCSADPDSPAVVNKLNWSLSPTWTYNLNSDSAPNSLKSVVPTIATRAFNTWQSGISNKVAFTRGNDTSTNRQAYDGVNIVAWGRTSGSALAVTYTRYYLATGQVVDVDTIMNQKFNWSWTDQTANSLCALSNSYDAQDILTHELGHWLGLDDEYAAAYIDNTMFGYGSKGEVKKDTLTSGDIAGAAAIYQ